MTIIDDSRVSIANIAANRYVGALWDQVEKIQKQVLTFQRNMDEWLIV